MLVRGEHPKGQFRRVQGRLSQFFAAAQIFNLTLMVNIPER
jgi:hypothetical protein